MSGGEPIGWRIYKDDREVAYLRNPRWRRVLHRLGFIRHSALHTRLVIGHGERPW